MQCQITGILKSNAAYESSIFSVSFVNYNAYVRNIENTIENTEREGPYP